MPQFPSNIDLTALNGTTGFKLIGANGSLTGASVASAGDVNGDGFADLIVGAPGSHASYVVFGHAGGFGSTVDLTTLNGTTGFALTGNLGVGQSVASAGDVNGDGIDDLIVSAPDGHGAAAYVVYGKTTGFAADVDLTNLTAADGFSITGVAAGNLAGISVASGDVNGDGINDLVVGAPSGAGAAYVVFGTSGGFGSNVDLTSLTGSNGFKFNGFGGSHTGTSVSTGDVNGDGFDDVIVGAPDNSQLDGTSGATFVIFGKASGFAAAFNGIALYGANGFTVFGENQSYSGDSVSAAGDINGDGFDDVIIGGGHSGFFYEGVSYVVFGKAGGFSSNFFIQDSNTHDLLLNGSNGFKISASAPNGYAGTSVSAAGDINGDGFDDLLVGAPGANTSYVLFGKAGGFSANVTVNSGGVQLDGAGAGFSVASAGDVNGDGFDDMIVGSPTAAGGGAGYVVFGRQPTTPVVRVGTDISQTLAGGTAHDVLIGQGGDDRLLGNGGSDILDGGDGNDVLNGGTGGDAMSGGDGNDTYYIDNAGDAIVEDVNQGTDTVHTTVSYMLAPNVEILISDAATGLILRGNNDANTIIGGDRNDTILGRGGDDTINGGGGADKIFGGIGADLILGGAGRDTIDGEAGNDRINGGWGADILTGGGGNNTFIYDDVRESGPTATARDTITDFHTGDQIDLSGIDAVFGGGHDAFTFVGSGAFTAKGQVRFEISGGNTLIEANTKGTLGADFSILLQGTHSLSAADFKLT